MDGRRFDHLAKSFATNGTRRGFLKGAIGGALGGLVALRGRGVLAGVPTITAGPTVVTKSATGATISWQTDFPADSRVEYGTTVTYDRRQNDPTLVVGHRVTLDRLDPGTTYHYRVRSVNSDGTRASTDRTFATCPSGRPDFCAGAGCVDRGSDRQHCGSCTRSCGAGQVCCNGKCCGAGNRCCNGLCIDPEVNTNHCGGCNRPCTSSSCVARSCERGTCVATTDNTKCPPNQVCDPQDDCVCHPGRVCRSTCIEYDDFGSETGTTPCDLCCKVSETCRDDLGGYRACCPSCAAGSSCTYTDDTDQLNRARCCPNRLVCEDRDGRRLCCPPDTTCTAGVDAQGSVCCPTCPAGSTCTAERQFDSLERSCCAVEKTCRDQDGLLRCCGSDRTCTEGVAETGGVCCPNCPAGTTCATGNGDSLVCCRTERLCRVPVGGGRTVIRCCDAGETCSAAPFRGCVRP